MGGVDRLSQVRKTYGLIENRNDTGYVLFFQGFFIMPLINNAYLFYKHNCKLLDMPPKELLDFRVDLVNLLIRRSRYRKRPVVPQSSSHSRDGAPSGCSLCRVGEVGISRGKCRHCLDVGRFPVHHTTFAYSFCKDSLFCRLSQNCSFLLIHSCSCMLGQFQVILVAVTFLCMCMYAD